MKRILFSIFSSNQELYRKISETALKGYMMWLERTPMNIDVLECTAGEKTERIGNTLYMGCDDGDIYKKGRILMEYILEHPEYDIIVNINVCTIVNIEFINRFVNSKEFDPNKFYGHGIVSVTDGKWWFTPGTCMMFSREFFMEHLCDFEKYDQYNVEIGNEYWHPATQYNNKGECMWVGVSNDAIWGKMVYDKYIDFVILPSITTRNYIPTVFRDDTFKINEAPIYDQHFAIPYDDRLIVEPITMGLAFMCMMNHTITNEEYKNIIGKILFFNKRNTEK